MLLGKPRPLLTCFDNCGLLNVLLECMGLALVHASTQSRYSQSVLSASSEDCHCLALWCVKLLLLPPAAPVS